MRLVLEVRRVGESGVDGQLSPPGCAEPTTFSGWLELLAHLEAWTNTTPAEERDLGLARMNDETHPVRSQDAAKGPRGDLVSVTDTLRVVDRNIASGGRACLADAVELVDMATGSVVRGSAEVASWIGSSLPRMDGSDVRLTIDEGRVAAEWPGSDDTGPLVCVYEVDTEAIVSIRVYADKTLGGRAIAASHRTS